MGVGGGFEQKILDKFSEKLGPCTPSMLSNYSFAAHSKTDFTIIFGPRMKSGGTYRIGLVRPSVCVCVRVYVTRFLGNRSSHRSETLGKVRDKNFKKSMLAGFFEKFPVPRKSGGTRQKMAQIEVFDT